jgi:hypothetical protein
VIARQGHGGIWTWQVCGLVGLKSNLRITLEARKKMGVEKEAVVFLKITD